MRRRMRQGLFAAAAALLLSGVAGCASDSWSAAADVNPSEWAAGAGILFPNADSLARYDATLFLRCNDRFAEDTLTVRIAVTTPDSLRRAIRLGRTGDYRFTVTPTRPIRGVEAVGLTIRKDR